ncbi:unnamed protein product [Larinioides sclopetarius]|uniref:Uncharacterized protein n=1 Tax=Larinioides sclopetarius TaxID=280406 RepID=A0AAV2BMQ8_9ARAC
MMLITNCTQENKVLKNINMILRIVNMFFEAANLF